LFSMGIIPPAKRIFSKKKGPANTTTHTVVIGGVGKANNILPGFGHVPNLDKNGVDLIINEKFMVFNIGVSYLDFRYRGVLFRFPI